MGLTLGDRCICGYVVEGVSMQWLYPGMGVYKFKSVSFVIHPLIGEVQVTYDYFLKQYREVKTESKDFQHLVYLWKCEPSKKENYKPGQIK